MVLRKQEKINSSIVMDENLLVSPITSEFVLINQAFSLDVGLNIYEHNIFAPIVCTSHCSNPCPATCVSLFWFWSHQQI